MGLNALDLAVIVTYLVLVTLFGLRFRRKRLNEQFCLGSSQGETIWPNFDLHSRKQPYSVVSDLDCPFPRPDYWSQGEWNLLMAVRTPVDSLL